MTLRARIGYTSVAFVTEIFPKVFYDIVPGRALLRMLTQQVTSLQAIAWEGLHKCGIEDRAEGYGKLLREY